MRLPLHIDVPVNHTPIIADLLGVLYAHDVNIASNWFFQTHMSMVQGKTPVASMHTNETITWFVPGQLHRKCPLIDSITLPDQSITKDSSSFSKMAREKLKDGFYVLCNVDCYDLRGTLFYQEEHRVHDILITGYEDNEFYCYDYFMNSGQAKYCTKQYSTLELDQAFYSKVEKNLPEYLGGTFCFKPKRNMNFQFNIERFRELVVLYLDGKCDDHFLEDELYQIEKVHGGDREEVAFGVDCYDAYSKFIDRIIPNKGLSTMMASMFVQHCDYKEALLHFLSTNGHLKQENLDELALRLSSLKKVCRSLLGCDIRASIDMHFFSPDQSKVYLATMRDLDVMFYQKLLQSLH